MSQIGVFDSTSSFIYLLFLVWKGDTYFYATILINSGFYFTIITTI